LIKNKDNNSFLMEEIKKLNRKKMRTIFLNEHRKKRKKSKKIENKCD